MKPKPFIWYIKRKYGQYEGLIRAIERRHQVYNDTLQYLFEEEKKGNVFIIAPTEKLQVGRMERDKEKLTYLYEQGYQDSKTLLEPLKEFLSEA